MLKHMICPFFISVVIGIFAFCGNSIAEEAISGWVLSEQAGPENLDQFLGEKFILKKDGAKLLFFDMQNKKVAEGTIQGNSITAMVHTNRDRIIINGVLGDQKISGTFVSPNGQQMSWKATKLGMLYQCSNHDPADIATTLEEMQRLTNERQCTGWTKVK